jgi:hypothetical protein
MPVSNMGSFIMQKAMTQTKKCETLASLFAQDFSMLISLVDKALGYKLESRGFETRWVKF